VHLYVISTNKVGVYYCVTIPVMGRALIMSSLQNKIFYRYTYIKNECVTFQSITKKFKNFTNCFII